MPEHNPHRLGAELGQIGSIGDSETRLNSPGGSQPGANERSVGVANTLGDSSAPGFPPTPESPFDVGPSQGFQQRYVVLETLGQGGMGIVYKVQDGYLKRTLALKRIQPDLQSSPKAKERFLAEAQAAAAISHFNVVQIFDVGSDQDGPFILMEYMEGESLSKRLERDGPYEMSEALRVFDQICQGVEAAHEVGVIHRDLKPGNILLTQRGTPKVGDFGLARLEEKAESGMTLVGAQLGTFTYAAPEQLVSGKTVDARCDVYALGATLYHMLVGEPPRTLRLERAPEEVRPILGKALEENPSLRYSTVMEFRKELRSLDDRHSAAAIGSPTTDVDSPLDCRSCGKLNSPRVRFCVECGESLAYHFQTCPQCQHENRTEAVKFCGGCGLDIHAYSYFMEQVNLVEGMIHSGDNQGAIKVLKALHTKDPRIKKLPETLLADSRDRLATLSKEAARISRLRKKAHSLEKANELDDAEGVWRSLLEVAPKDEEAQEKIRSIPLLREQNRIKELRRRARAAERKEQFDNAEKLWKELSSIAPTDQAAKERLKEIPNQRQKARIRDKREEAHLAEREGRLEEAVEAWATLLSIVPDDPEAFDRINQISQILEDQKVERLKGEIHAALSGGKWRNAQITLEELRRSRPSDPDADREVEERIRKLREAEEIAKEVAGTEAQIQTALEWCNHREVVKLALLLRDRGQLSEEFRKIGSESFHTLKEIETLCNQARQYRDQGEFASALELWDRALLLDPFNEEIKMDRRCVEMEHEREQSILASHESRDHRATIEKAKDLTGLSRKATSAVESAKATLERVARLKKDAVAAAEEYDYAAALELLNEAREADPKDKDIPGDLEVIRRIGSLVSKIRESARDGNHTHVLELAEEIQRWGPIPLEIVCLVNSSTRRVAFRKWFPFIGGWVLLLVCCLFILDYAINPKGSRRYGDVGLRVEGKVRPPHLAPSVPLNVSFPTQTANQSPAHSTITNSIGMKMVLIPAGEFMMGSERGEQDERPVHPVRIDKPFFLGMTEVTQAQWKAVMGNNPSSFKGDDTLPVESISWEDCQDFVKNLSTKEGKSYRLPSEAEWEYACRAGSTTEYSFGDEESRLGEYGWFRSNSGRRTHPVGQRNPNAWGVYDMHGNVWEWCEDPIVDLYRVHRGGSWFSYPNDCRSANRYRLTPTSRISDLGFRVARTP